MGVQTMKAQIILIVLTAISLGITVANHGKPRPPYSIGLSLVDIAIVYSLLYWGGFWDVLFK